MKWHRLIHLALLPMSSCGRRNMTVAEFVRIR